MDFLSFDGTRISWREIGTGRPLVLLHGLFSNAEVNWIKFGTADRLADAGYRVILPDLRGHGESDTPTDADAWPEDVLALDHEALLSHLGLSDDPSLILGGYSLGARTTMRLLDRGMSPAAVILAGMGLEGITRAENRGGWFIRLIQNRETYKRGDSEFLAAAFLKSNVKQPDPLVHLLDKQLNTPQSAFAGFTMPTLVVCGADDHDNGSAPALADALPAGVYSEIPGTHMASVTRPELADAMLAFLSGL